MGILFLRNTFLSLTKIGLNRDMSSCHLPIPGVETLKISPSGGILKNLDSSYPTRILFICWNFKTMECVSVESRPLVGRGNDF